VIGSVRPPLPARPEKGTTATARTPALKLVPDSRTPDQLAPTRPQASRVDVRRLPAGRCPAAFTRQRLASRARTLKPAASDVNVRARTSPAMTSEAPTPVCASRAGSCTALRAPLLQPGHAVAHGRPLDLARLVPMGSPRHRNDPRPSRRASSGPASWSPFWSPFFCRAPTLPGSRWRSPNRAGAAKALELTRFGSL
jgi:hypothetical protein